MTNNTPDYEDNLAFEPKSKSADDLNKQGRESDVWVSALEEQNAELTETNASLSSQIKYLLDLQKEKDKEVERLRKLLKECKNIVAHDLWSKAQFPDGQVVEKDDILTRINAALGESEE